MRNPLELLGGSARVAEVAARAPVPMAPPNRPRLATAFSASDKVVQMDTMAQLGVLWGIIDTRATSIAGVEWELYERPGRVRRARDEERRLVENHRARVTWEQPTPFHDRDDLVRLWSYHRDLVGESYIASVAGPVPELWPLRPDRMVPASHPTKFITGWIYRGPNGEDVPLRVGQVAYHRLPHPYDPYRGLGPVQALLVDLDATHAAAEWNLNFFLNSALPGGVIEHPQPMTPAQFAQFYEQWEAQHKGVDNAHRVALITGGTWKDRAMSMRDMEFTELRRLSDEQIRQAFGMSKTMQGLSEDVNRATADAARHVYGRLRDVPRLNLLRRWLNTKVLPMFGPAGSRLEWDYDVAQVLPENVEAEVLDRDSRVRAAVAMIGGGASFDSAVEAFELPLALAAEVERVVGEDNDEAGAELEDAALEGARAALVAPQRAVEAIAAAVGSW